MITSISHITLFVSNQERALTFYQNIGFEVHTDAQLGGMRWLTLCLPQQKNLELVLMLAETAVEKALVGKQDGDKPIFNLATDNCEQDYERLSQQGVTFTQKPITEPWGISAVFKDSEGNTVYLCQSHEGQHGE